MPRNRREHPHAPRAESPPRDAMQCAVLPESERVDPHEGRRTQPARLSRHRESASDTRGKDRHFANRNKRDDDEMRQTCRQVCV
mmetsp:Transcript_11157/g.32376  ORF Transcript_11157/g.32376 Transcript_11157/m.32376 type:complete len:84 (-) Transcript_11157:1368-1619(-)